jgi:hypothetical protein
MNVLYLESWNLGHATTFAFKEHATTLFALRRCLGNGIWVIFFLHWNLELKTCELGVVVYTCNPSTWEAEAERWNVQG